MNISPARPIARPEINALNGKPFAGGVPFKLPFGTIYSTNITADRETGIGSWSDDDFVRGHCQGKFV